MQSSTILSLNVQTPNYATVMHAVQFDKLSRKITAYLFDGALPFIPPEGALAMVRYSKPDGTMGFYDTLEDGETAAVTWEGNTATVWLAEQVLTVAGNVLCQIQFFTSTERLSTFTFVIGVEANAVSDESIESTDYFSILTQRIEAILGAVAYPPSINAQGHWMLFDTETQQYYDSGVDATGPTGQTGPTGPYMASIAKVSGTGAPGTTDQYQVTLSDGTHPTGTISVYNGSDGEGAPGSSTPLMDGTAAVGSATAYSREDHVHPTDTSRASAEDVSDLQSDVSNIQEDISDLQGDVSDLQNDVAGLEILVEMVNGGSLSTNSSGYYSGSFSVAKIGYTPIGVVGYTMSTTFVAIPTLQISSSNIFLEIRAIGGGIVSFNPKVWVLYKKA